MIIYFIITYQKDTVSTLAYISNHVLDMILNKFRLPTISSKNSNFRYLPKAHTEFFGQINFFDPFYIRNFLKYPPGYVECDFWADFSQKFQSPILWFSQSKSKNFPNFVKGTIHKLCKQARGEGGQPNAYATT